MRILAFESSCDDSAAAYLDVRDGKVNVLKTVVTTQTIHIKYGGVVPEVAAREHAATFPALLRAIAEEVCGAGVGDDFGAALKEKVDAIAVTQGPGLVTSLRVGIDAARALGLAWGVPVFGLNHIEGHVYSNWLVNEGEQMVLSDENGKGDFPALVLVVSGGHSELLYMKKHRSYELLGSTRDDAAGEAFDKTAKLLGLSYPGGPQISRMAREGRRDAFDFPRPMIHEEHFDFSFSGLKTAVRYFLERNADRLSDAVFMNDVAASLETAIVDVLVEKTVRAAQKKKVKTVLLAGGVAANGYLRTRLREALQQRLPKVVFVEPIMKFCTDNAAMIAMAGHVAMKNGARSTVIGTMQPKIGWELGR